jgi:hypothetical protein
VIETPTTCPNDFDGIINRNTASKSQRIERIFCIEHHLVKFSFYSEQILLSNKKDAEQNQPLNKNLCRVKKLWKGPSDMAYRA